MVNFASIANTKIAYDGYFYSFFLDVSKENMIGLVWVMMCIIQFDSLEENILFLKVLYSLFGAILFRIQDHLESAEFCPEKRDKIYVKTQ